MAINEQILIKINWLKKSLSYNCIFCGHKMSRDYPGRELLTLPICHLCLDRYNIIKNKEITVKQKQFLNNWFAGKCYFCEKDSNDLKQTQEGYKLCQTACYQRFRMISGWQDKNETLGGDGKKPVIKVSPSNVYGSYSEALKALHSAKKTGSSFVFSELEKRNKK